MNYQWYPGHMTKAVRMMQENIKLIDLVIELADARIPLSSRNPDIDKLAAGKYRIVLLNKSDLADPVYNKQWTAFFESRDVHVREINSRTGGGVKSIQGLVTEVCRERLERDRRRGIVNRPVRAMVVGIPNVGKSTFINSFVGKACARTGNKPGITKGKQWIRLNRGLELLDTPGILWPRFEDQQAGMRLAFIGSMNDEVVIMEELACDLIGCLQSLYPQALPRRYGISGEGAPDAVLTEIAKSRGCYARGQEPDLEKASSLLMEDFRGGRLGRITLERPESFSGGAAQTFVSDAQERPQAAPGRD